MDANEYVEAITRESRALAAAAELAPAAEVASCPGWDMLDLVLHTGGVHRFWNEVVERRLQSYEDASTADVPDRDGAVGWFRTGAQNLVESLTAADPDEPVWTWAQQKNVAFVCRRMAQETTVHRWDAESAAGDPGPIEAGLAIDGVDEFLDVGMPAEERPFGHPGESIHLHRTDGEGEWVLYCGPEWISVERSHAKGSVAVRAPASDLLLLLWRRVRPGDVEVFGDEQLLVEFLAWMDLD
ncbi:MAG: maleylpyruvate isomerase family mycothiol-dependent enzyme [Actinomycetota bacterium]|nr:maleylpyruvate isomerase family mycothiol-dependent enzyme [Actinomycetota bacterium]